MIRRDRSARGTADRVRRGAWAAGLAAVQVSSLFAHDLWLEPSSFSPEPGAEITVGIRVGEGFRGDAVGRPAERIVRFELLDGRGATPLPGAAGADPAGAGTVDAAAGGVTALYVSRPARLALSRERFEAYLAEEGLERISDERRARGQSERPGLEIYSRCAKAILRVAGAGSQQSGTDASAAPAGCAFELVPESLPAVAGETATFRALFHGAPAEGVKVFALERAAGGSPAERAERTDAAGRVRFRLERDGVWLVKAVQMDRAPKGTGADWESFWASVVFEIGGPDRLTSRSGKDAG